VGKKEEQMAQEFTMSDLKDILVNRVGLPEDQVPDDPNVSFEDLGLDSLAFVEIQLAVQQQFGFAIPDEDAHEITTMGQAIDYTNRRLQEQS
jgi:acyl carrier protein